MVLVDGEPIVVLWIVEVDHSRLRPADRAVGGAVLDRHTVYEQAVEGAYWLRAFAPSGRVTVRKAFGGQLAGGDLGTVCDLPAEAAQPVEGGIFHDGFGQTRHSECLVVGLGACSLSFRTPA